MDIFESSPCQYKTLDSIVAMLKENIVEY